MTNVVSKLDAKLKSELAQQAQEELKQNGLAIVPGGQTTNTVLLTKVANIVNSKTTVDLKSIVDLVVTANIQNITEQTCSSSATDSQTAIAKHIMWKGDVNITSQQATVMDSMRKCVQSSTAGVSTASDFGSVTTTTVKGDMDAVIKAVAKQVAKDKMAQSGVLASIMNSLKGMVGIIVAVVGGLSGLCYVMISCIVIGLIIFMIVKGMGGKKGSKIGTPTVAEMLAALPST